MFYFKNPQKPIDTMLFYIAMDNLIELIKQKQKAERLKDQEIADAIGVNVTTWRRIKGGRQYGRKFLDSVKRAFPDIFCPLMLLFIAFIIAALPSQPLPPNQSTGASGRGGWLLKSRISLRVVKKEGGMVKAIISMTIVFFAIVFLYSYIFNSKF